MWYIIRTDYSTETSVEEVLRNLPFVSRTYLPRYRLYLPKRTDGKKYKFCLTIRGVVFVNVTEPHRVDFCRSMTRTGYLLDANGKQYDGNPHLIQPSNPRLTLSDILSLSRVSYDEFELFRIYNDQRDIERSMERLDLVDDVTYRELERGYDTVCVIDGPYAHFQGVVKREDNVVDGKRRGRDNRLFCRMGIWSVRISNIRKYNYVIVREAVDGKEFQLTNTWRFIDRLIGSLQSAFFADDAPVALRTILTYMNGCSLDTAKHRLRAASLDSNDSELKRRLSFAATFLEEMDTPTQGSLTVLSRYFQTVDGLVGESLESVIPDTPLRPFLTPTSGRRLAHNARYALLRHGAFLEVILRLDLRSEFIKSKYLIPKGLPQSADDYVYYAHIGIKPDDSGTGLTAFVNWSGLIDTYRMRDSESQSQLLSSLRGHGVESMAELLSPADADRPSPVRMFWQSPGLAGFCIDIPSSDMDSIVSLLTSHEGESSLPYTILHRLHPVSVLLRRTIPAAVDMWQCPRLGTWRRLVQRYVLLHKIPVKDE